MRAMFGFRVSSLSTSWPSWPVGAHKTCSKSKAWILSPKVSVYAAQHAHGSSSHPRSPATHSMLARPRNPRPMLKRYACVWVSRSHLRGQMVTCNTSLIRTEVIRLHKNQIPERMRSESNDQSIGRRAVYKRLETWFSCAHASWIARAQSLQ